MTPLDPIISGTLAALLGLVFGSFTTFISHRLPREETLGGRSRCPSCGTALGPIDLVPVLSWLVQSGRCRHCGTSISARYPAIEVTMSALFVAIYLHAGPTLEGLLLAALAVGLVTLVTTDLEIGIIPDKVILILAPLGLLYRATLDDILIALAGGVIAGGFGYALRLGFMRLRGRDPLGLGDIKFLAMAGLWLGPHGLPVFMVFSGVSGVLFGLLWTRVVGDKEFPFGPALALGLFLCLMFPGLTQWLA